ncbi:DNA helicase [Bertholletia excelsa]
MSLGIVDYESQDETHSLYDVIFFEDRVYTLVTSTPAMVDSWIAEIEQIHWRRLHRLIVGLDVEWRPNNRHFDNPIATLQLCVGRRCLIFQMLHAEGVIPESLINFLGEPNYTFVGVGIDDDVEKLMGDYGISVSTTVDLRSLAADVYGVREFRTAGLKTLAREVLGKEVNKPKSITRSRWDYRWLTPAQVQYACIDAFLSFEIGRRLNAAG